jgi:GTP-binding protein
MMPENMAPISEDSSMAEGGGNSPAYAGFMEQGRLLFAQPCDFIFGSPTIAALPPIGGPEIAFAGRSNVGKSSLINALTNRKTLARTSHTPGRTQQLNFFALGEAMRLVDMPGYGYAAVSKSLIASWGSLMRDFLRGRSTLLRVYLLIDGRHGLKDSDAAMMDLFDKSAISYAVVLTKQDEVKQADRPKRIMETEGALSKRPAAFPTVLFTSAETGEGIAELRASIALLLHERAG